jgi:CDP-diacylglycerol--serine O-phosphatidyltransferase
LNHQAYKALLRVSVFFVKGSFVEKSQGDDAQSLRQRASSVARFGGRRVPVRATIYLLPNMITSASLFFGFLSFRLSAEGNFLFAAYAILAAGVCDGLDGSVARLTRTQSAFGVQFDSLCDLVAFGVAPAWMAYQFAAKDLGRLGFAACFIYLACGALRLARFNVASSVGRASGNFSGVPIPIAAAALSVYIMLQSDLVEWLGDESLPVWMHEIARTLQSAPVNKGVLIALLFILAAVMISTFEYFSTKKIRLPRRKPFRVLAAILIGTVLLATIDLTVTLSLLLVVYLLHGPFMALFLKRDRSAEEEAIFRAAHEDEDDDEDEEDDGTAESNNGDRRSGFRRKTDKQ